MNEIEGFEIFSEMKASTLVDGLSNLGFQASELGKAVNVFKRMREDRAKVFLSFTSNMVSSGLREVFAQCCRDKLVDVIVTGSGSIEEDLMKSRAPFLKGSFDADDSKLAEKKLNRIGNVLVPDEYYSFLEEYLKGFYSELYSGKKVWLSSEVNAELGRRISDEKSFLHQACKNNIPVFNPAFSDGAIGVQAMFFQQDHPDFAVDAVRDLKLLVQEVMGTKKVGAILLGGGFAKHHVIFASLLHNGLDYAVYVSTGNPWSGSLSGAPPSEALSWRKVKSAENTASVKCDATIAFPLIIAGVKG